MEFFKSHRFSQEEKEYLISLTQNKLSNAVLEAVGSADGLFDQDNFFLTQQLLHNTLSFSVFKQHDFQEKLAGLLVKNGAPTPWEEFKTEALKLNNKTNAVQLKIEYYQPDFHKGASVL
ncbi:MAG: hypothetical protein C4K58_06860 [Flavobacteriaceae bacterium]|nr:MAG: hypothetical protein C4K58_06860 [Flavobacteriaceae bacterium]